MPAMTTQRAPCAGARLAGSWCDRPAVAYRLAAPVTTTTHAGGALTIGTATAAPNATFSPGTRAPEEVLT